MSGARRLNTPPTDRTLRHGAVEDTMAYSRLVQTSLTLPLTHATKSDESRARTR
jgi:hypothetical protein